MNTPFFWMKSLKLLIYKRNKKFMVPETINSRSISSSCVVYSQLSY
jgi:hypothetical protein